MIQYVGGRKSIRFEGPQGHCAFAGEHLLIVGDNDSSPWQFEVKICLQGRDEPLIVRMSHSTLYDIQCSMSGVRGSVVIATETPDGKMLNINPKHILWMEAELQKPLTETP